jgi:hypothetical protein
LATVTSADHSYDLELAAASLRADNQDIEVLLTVMIDHLSDVLGSRLRVQRTGGRFRKPSRISSVTVALGDDEFGTEVDATVVRCTISHSSGGIRIRSEKVDIDTWLARLLAALQAEARSSQAVRQALEGILIGGGGPT